MSEVRLRDVIPEDLPELFEHQHDPVSSRMATFPARDREAFDAHWARILVDPAVRSRTIVWDDRVAKIEDERVTEVIEEFVLRLDAAS